jgi:Rab GDP dissociation inhibitor
MGIFEKRRMKKFMEFVGGYKEEDQTTHQGTRIFPQEMLIVRIEFGQGYNGRGLHQVWS